MTVYQPDAAEPTGPRPPLKVADDGVSLRDYIAIHASDDDVDDMPWCKWIDEAYVEMGRADRRYAFADAMLAARRG